MKDYRLRNNYNNDSLCVINSNIWSHIVFVFNPKNRNVWVDFLLLLLAILNFIWNIMDPPWEEGEGFKHRDNLVVENSFT